MTAVLVAAYLGAIVAANLLVAAFGPAVTIVNAFLLIGLDLTCRDRLHDRWGDHLARNMGLLIGTGGLLSWLVNADAGHIALASTVAFVVAAVADAVVYHAARRWPYLARVNTSNVAGAAADSLLFPTLAFGGLLWGITAGQFVAKLAGGFVWSLVLKPRRAEVPA